jgi:RNA polymerase sigma-70 factor (ECF subfamily)
MEDSAELETLLLHLQRGDQRALRELYTALSGPIYSLAWQLLGSREEAEEVLQDTFVNLYHSKGFDPAKGSARAYVYTVARNACLTRLRARRARPDKADAWDVHDPDAPFSGPTTDPVLRVQTEQLLAQLDPLDRTLVEHAFYGGYSHRELAARFGLPLGTVKSRVRRALLALRERLETS